MYNPTTEFSVAWSGLHIPKEGSRHTWLLHHSCIGASLGAGVTEIDRPGSVSPTATVTKAACIPASEMAHIWVMSVCHWFFGTLVGNNGVAILDVGIISLATGSKKNSESSNVLNSQKKRWVDRDGGSDSENPIPIASPSKDIGSEDERGAAPAMASRKLAKGPHWPLKLHSCVCIRHASGDAASHEMLSSGLSLLPWDSPYQRSSL